MFGMGASGCVTRGGVTLSHVSIDGAGIGRSLPARSQGALETSTTGASAGPSSSLSHYHNGGSLVHRTSRSASQSTYRLAAGARRAMSAHKLPASSPSAPPGLTSESHTNMCRLRIHRRSLARRGVSARKQVAGGGGGVAAQCRAMRSDGACSSAADQSQSSHQNDGLAAPSPSPPPVAGEHPKDFKSEGDAGKDPSQLLPRHHVTRRMLAGFAGGVMVPSLLTLVLRSRLDFAQADSSAAHHPSEILQLASFERSKVRRSREALLIPDDLSKDLSTQPRTQAGAAAQGGIGGGVAEAEKTSSVTQQPNTNASSQSVGSQRKVNDNINIAKEPATAATAATAAGGGGRGGEKAVEAVSSLRLTEKGVQTVVSDVEQGSSGGDSGLLTGVGFLAAAGFGTGWITERSAKANLQEEAQANKALYEKQLRTQERALSEVSEKAASEVSSLQTSLQRSEDGKKLLTREVSALQAKLSGTEADVLEAKAAIAASETAREDLQVNMNQSLREKEEEITKLVADCGSLRSALTSAETAGQNLEKELVDLRASCQSLQSSLTSAEAVGQSLKKELAEVRETCGSLQSSLASAEALALHSENQLAEARALLSAKEREVEELQGSLEEAVKEARETDKHVAGLKDRLNELGEALAAEQATAQKLVQEVGKERAEVELREKEVTVLKTALKDSTEKINDLEVQVRNIAGVLQAKAALWEESKAQLQAMEQQLEEERKAGQTLREDLLMETEAKATLAAQLEEAKAEAVTQRQLKDELAMEIDRQGEDIERLRAAVDSWTSQLETMEQKLRQEKAAVKQAKAEMEAMREALHTEQSKLSEMQEGLRSASGEVAAMEAEKSELLAKAEKAETETVSLSKEIADLRAALANAEAEAEELSKLKKDIEVMGRERDGHEERAALLEEDVNVAKLEVSRLSGVITETKRLLLVAQEKISQIAEIRAEAALMVEHFEDVAGREREEKEQLQEKADSLAKQRATEQEANRMLSKELDSVREELAHVQLCLNEAQAERAAAKAMVDSLMASSAPAADDEEVNNSGTTEVETIIASTKTGAAASTSKSASPRKSSGARRTKPNTGVTS